MTRSWGILIIAACAGLLVTGCGDDDDGSSGSVIPADELAPGTASVLLDGQLLAGSVACDGFDVTIDVGNAVIEYTSGDIDNPSQVVVSEEDETVEASEVTAVELVGSPASGTIDAELEDGRDVSASVACE